VAEIISNAGQLGAPDGTGNPLCAAIDSAVNFARRRLWIAVPWVYTRTNSPWLLGLIQRVAGVSARGGVDVRAYLRPNQNNAYAVNLWKQAGVTVVQSTARTRYMHSKVIVSDDAALVMTANLTDTDLFRNVNHISVERERSAVDAAVASVLLLEEDTPEDSGLVEFTRTEELVPPEIHRLLGVDKLNPMQAGAVPKVLHERRNLVVAAATGAGKTLVAEVALLQEALERGRCGVYLAPMRSIASEKKTDWQRLEAGGLRVYKTTGEDDAFDPGQAMNADVIVATPEKWDSVSRRQVPPELISRIGVIVIDEVHLVDDDNRGPSLEALLARINLAFPAARLVAMSGTLSNADAIARWLNADLYESSWRPVTLTTVVVPYPKSKSWRDDEITRNGLAAPIARETVDDGGAVLVFCGSRKGVEGCALHLAEALGQPAPRMGRRVQNAELARALNGGVGFHHAGLGRDDRAIVEQLFRSGAIKVLVATSTVAAGVNLPARVVIVRDLTLGVDDVSAPELLQMAGRAGRPGLEKDGRCYVLAPTERLADVQQMLPGRPIGSHIGDDLATHLNTEIVLGIVRSRADAVSWYGRTLHAHLGNTSLDPGEAIDQLVHGGFALDREDVLEPTQLGRATSDLMIQVGSASALENWLSRRSLRTRDPVALEIELLTAACGYPLEFADLPSRVAENELYEHIKRNHKGAAEWAQGRLRYFAVTCSVLSGVKAEGLPIDNGHSLVAAVQAEVPRFLRFVARRADERQPGAPDLAAASLDLATTLEFGITERGGGVLLEVVKRAYQPDESRRRKVLADYRRLVSDGADSLDAALPDLAPRAREAAEQRPHLAPSIVVSHDNLLLKAGSARRPARVHTRVTTAHREIVYRAESASLAEVELGPVTALGRQGSQCVTVEVFAATLGGAAWSYASCDATLEVPAPPIDFAGARNALQSRTDAEYDSATSKGFLHRVGEKVFGANPLDAAHQQILDAPPRVKKAATVLAKGLVTPADKAIAVRTLIAEYEQAPGAQKPRPLSLIADAQEITQFEAAVLATALLRYMGVEAEILSAKLDGESAALCTWRYAGRTYGLPIWTTKYVHVDGATKLEAWTDEADRGEAPSVGWEVLRAYQRFSRRSLPFALAEAPATSTAAPAPPQSGPQSGTPAVNGPACPGCGSPMRKRSGKFGPFWGCSRYPDCKRTVQM
jgi:replicative superfamily II helicase